MRTLLLLSLLIFTISEGTLGSWTKHSIWENDLFIDQSFSEAAKDYCEDKEGLTRDDLLPLTVYTQVVNGKNYKICFIDSVKNSDTIQEYVITMPSKSGSNDLEFKVTSKKELKLKNKKIEINDKIFVTVEKNLTKYLKGTVEELEEVSSVGGIENDETLFYIVEAKTKEGEHKYVVYQDKKNDEFYDPVRVN